jgi:hypothetical protein
MLVKNKTSWKKKIQLTLLEKKLHALIYNRYLARIYSSLDFFFSIKTFIDFFNMFFYFKKILSENQNIYTYMQSNKLRTVYINKWKKKHKRWLNIKTGKIERHV